MKVKTQNNQNFWDIAIRYAGDVSAAYDIAALAGCSVTDPPPPEIEVPQMLNATVVAYYEALGIVPATRCDNLLYKQLMKHYENTQRNTRGHRGQVGL